MKRWRQRNKRAPIKSAESQSKHRRLVSGTASPFYDILPGFVVTLLRGSRLYKLQHRGTRPLVITTPQEAQPPAGRRGEKRFRPIESKKKSGSSDGTLRISTTGLGTRGARTSHLISGGASERACVDSTKMACRAVGGWATARYRRRARDGVESASDIADAAASSRSSIERVPNASAYDTHTHSRAQRGSHRESRRTGRSTLARTVRGS